MEISATIQAIGPNALSDKDPMIILFGPEATASIREVAVIQAFDDEQAVQTFELALGDTVTIDQAPYTVTFVGQLANQNLQTIGHITLIFSAEIPEDTLANAIYLQPSQRPQFAVGSRITYTHQA